MSKYHSVKTSEAEHGKFTGAIVIPLVSVSDGTLEPWYQKTEQHGVHMLRMAMRAARLYSDGSMLDGTSSDDGVYRGNCNSA